jgi:hypothetical protein
MTTAVSSGVQPGVFLASAGDFSRSSTVIQDRTATYVDELIPAPKKCALRPSYPC